MPHDPHLLATAKWLIEMDENPLTGGPGGHAVYRMKELVASHPMYRDLPALIAELRASASSSPGSPSAKDAPASAASAGSPACSPRKRP